MYNNNGDLVLEEHVDKREELIRGNLSYNDITEIVCKMPETPLRRINNFWFIGFCFSFFLMTIFFGSIAYLIWTGIGIWGNNSPVFWAFDIVNFVFWVGIGHAGTLISAILFLFRQDWRTSINRYAEAMTIFAVICALTFPAIHVGRFWCAYYFFPVPNQMAVWPNFRSPLLWDLFAVGTYFTVSLLFWFVGLVPDLATLRDRAKSKKARILYGIFSLGWIGSVRHWVHYERAYLLLAALSAPLVLSVHSVVSFDFATSQLPGWHTTIFPPYFVAGAIFSGFAMVQTLMLPARKWLNLKNIVTMKHIENMNKIILLTGSLVGYAYGIEFFMAWYSGNEYESFTFINRAFGPYAWAYWIMVSCNVLSPQLFWVRKFRTNIILSFIVSIIVNIGMWFERFVIIVTSLNRDFLPSSWHYYSPQKWDFIFFIGSFGLFFTLFLLFIKYLPVIAMSEVKSTILNANNEVNHHE